VAAELGREVRSASLADVARGEPLPLDWEAAREWAAGGRGIVIALAAVSCLVHFLCSGRYGYFRDELYFAACGEHLAWGYVDQAPLIALIARVSRVLLGDSLFALRFFPALASGATVLVAGAIARELGGQRFAQALAALTTLCAPIYLTFGNLLTMNAFEPLFWGLCALAAIRAVRRGKPHLWLLFGLLAGIGLENKHSTLFFGSGIFVGLLITEQRREFRSRWIWLAGLTAFLVFLPNLLWQAGHGWPTLEFLRVRQPAQNFPVSALTFIAEQALLANPVAAPVALAGLSFLLFSPAATSYRFLGWGYLVVLAELILLQGKIYYLSPYDLILFAAGSVCVERWVARSGRAWWKPAILAPIAASAMVAAPLALPLLPVEGAVRYARFWHVKAVRVEVQSESELPQLFADMFGWENQVATVAAARRRLSPEDQQRAVILAGAYGEAAAVDYFSARYRLPKAICAENAYYLWGPRGSSNEVVVAFGINRTKLGQVFEEIVQVDTIRSPYAMPDETDIPVFICRKPRMSFEKAWPILHSFG
jgi:hypothetical protein